MPGLYTQSPPETSFPRDMVETCTEGAGGGNVRHFICNPDGTIRLYFAGYWRPERFLRELSPHDHEGDPTHSSIAVAQRNLHLRNHRESEMFRGRPIREVLRQIADEVYTKGKTG